MTLPLSLPQSFVSMWDTWNASDSWLPLFGSLTLWISTWLFAKSQKWDYARCYRIHTFHHSMAIILASTSLYFNDDIIFNERLGIFWSMGYFMVDILDCTIAGHVLYVTHGVVCLILGLCNYNIPLLRQLRMNSRASYIETSSILLYQVKQRRLPWLFVVFALTYTACRIVWIPFMMRTLLTNGVQWHDVIFLLLVAFYGLQIWWWIKILNILVNGSEDGDSKKKTTTLTSNENGKDKENEDDTIKKKK